MGKLGQQDLKTVQLREHTITNVLTEQIQLGRRDRTMPLALRRK